MWRTNQTLAWREPNHHFLHLHPSPFPSSDEEGRRDGDPTMKRNFEEMYLERIA